MTLTFRVLAVFAFVASCFGCTERIRLDHGDAGLPGLVSIQVSPPTTTLAIDDLSQPAQTVTYTAVGTFVDATTRDVTALVDWSVDNAGPGAFVTPGVYSSSNAAAGHVIVTASNGAVSGTAALTVMVTLTIVDGVFPPPEGADSAFTSGLPVVTADPMRSPVIVYPSNNTMFPQGLARILFQYTGGMNNDTFALSFGSDVLHVVVYTGSDRWQPDDDIWTLISLSGNGDPVSFAVEGVNSAMPTTIYANAPATLQFANALPVGMLTYFSASTNGVMRGLLDATSASKLYPPTNDATCAGCHSISRSGTAMAFGYGGETLQTIGLPSLATQIAPAANLPMGWATWSPAGDQLLVASRGVLTLYAANGIPVGIVPLPNGILATHPDWSPDGTSVVVALATMIDPMDMDMQGGSIATLSYTNGVWGMPNVLVTSTNNNDNNFFPRWSPDGRLIAYVHADSSSHKAPTAELRSINAGGGTPVPLRLASHRLGFTDDVPNLSDTMPTWVIAQGNIQWLAFATTRPYGLIQSGMGPSQIWLAGIDVTQTDGSDPSFAAFWLPCQDITMVNNNPIWAPTATSEAR